MIKRDNLVISRLEQQEDSGDTKVLIRIRNLKTAISNLTKKRGWYLTVDQIFQSLWFLLGSPW
jgi:hypothetical protein